MAEVSTATLHARADQAAANGDFVAALAASAEALRAVPLDHRARLKVGLCLSMLQRSDDAMATLQVVADSLAHRGFMLAAVGACRDAIGLAPEHPGLRETLLMLHARFAGTDDAGRPRIPPPVPPADVDDSVPDAFTALSGEALLTAAAELGRRSPTDGEAVPAGPVPLFSELSSEAFAALVPELGYLKVPAGHAVIRQGQPGTSVFVLLEGEVRVSRQGEGIAVDLAFLKGGSLFGELALLTDKPRQADVTTTQPSELFEIPKKALERVAEAHPAVTEAIVAFARRRLLLNVMATSPLFGPLAPPQRVEILKRFQPRIIEGGTVIIADGQPPQGLYVVVEGAVEVSKVDDAGDRVVLAYLRAGEVFGEIGLVEHQPASADVRASEKSVVLFLGRAEFDGFVEAHPAVLEVLKDLSGARREELEEAMADGVVVDADDLIIV